MGSLALIARGSSDSPTIRLPVAFGPKLRNGTPLVLGTATTQALNDRFTVPTRDHLRKTGYQREASTTRVNRLMSDLRQRRVDLPTAVLLNFRAYDATIHLVTDGHERVLLIPPGQRLYVVDGQHRIEAIVRLFREDPERWGGFELPFVCMLGASERDEMEQFYIVNSTAKSVRTDLALDLLKQRAETDPLVMQGLIERNESWKVTAQALAERLAQTSIWRDRIRFAGEPKRETTVSSAAMVASLHPLLNTAYFQTLKTPERQAPVLESYWRGIQRCLPEVFDTPSEFTLQKGLGTYAMHRVLPQVLELVRSRGWSVVEPDSYEKVLHETLTTLEGDTATGDVARGADFWRTGEAGAAGSFSSSSGQRVLVAKIVALLPEAPIE